MQRMTIHLLTTPNATNCDNVIAYRMPTGLPTMPASAQQRERKLCVPVGGGATGALRSVLEYTRA